LQAGLPASRLVFWTAGAGERPTCSRHHLTDRPACVTGGLHSRECDGRDPPASYNHSVRSAERFAFGPFELDVRTRRLLRAGAPVALGGRQFELLHALVARAGEVLSKDQLIASAWDDVAVTDNSLEQAISALRRTLAMPGTTFIDTHARRGYRFTAAVTRIERRETDDGLEALLAPHRSWLEGRAALETLEASRIAHARDVFERVVHAVPAHAAAHVGLANACALQYEMTRTDATPDASALDRAAAHAREACRLEPESAEAWATLGFVLDRCGQRGDARAAGRRAVALEPDNWRHHLRLAYASWGEERLRAARRTLALLPGFPLAAWLAATVHVARGALSEAERELMGVQVSPPLEVAPVRFAAVGVDWLRGLLRVAAGDERGGVAALEREIAAEHNGQLYARECCANAWYALGAVHLHARRIDEARRAAAEAMARVPLHPGAHVIAALLDGEASAANPPRVQTPGDDARSAAFEVAVPAVAPLILTGRHSDAVVLVDRALARAEEEQATGWLLPIEPLLRAWERPELWAPVLARLRHRAA
jgi:DNA-binding winged helix-turn-helix (wHTH) protein